MSLRLAVIGTFHGRLENTLPLLRRVLVESTRRPDEFWIMCEDEYDVQTILEGLAVLYREHHILPLDEEGEFRNFVRLRETPRTETGQYAVIPYSAKINWALDRTQADVICYLDNGSMPHPDKYQHMVYGLACNPDWGAAYCTQHRTGYLDVVHYADKVIPNGHYQTNYTQVAHRPTADRWSLNMAHADPDIADALFFADLAKSLGPLHPVGGLEPLDEHHMPSAAAAGI